jgi:phage replication O-like protein O
MEMERRKKDGFRPIPNSLFQAMMSAQLTASGYQVLLKVIDETIGFHREEAKIPLTRFQKATGLSRQSVRSAIKQAEERCIIQVQRDSTRPSVYALKDHREWLTRQRNHPSKLGNEITPDWETKSPQTRKLAMPTTTGIKETLKETLKERVPTTETRVLNRTLYEGTSPPQTPPSYQRVRPIPKEASTANDKARSTTSKEKILIKANPKKTYRERIMAYLNANGPSSVRAISEGTGIKSNPLNVTLHNGKGKVFYHDSEKRVWGFINEGDE